MQFKEYKINETTDFNAVILELTRLMAQTKLYFKASDQRGKVGNIIFDPKGTNCAIKTVLETGGWVAADIPDAYSALGNDVDFEKDGHILEVQFSNYPFFLNNLIRSEILCRNHCILRTSPVKSLIVVTKVGAFDSSNSTLYYEQAVAQLDFLHAQNMITIPVCILGIYAENGTIPAMWTTYSDARYSRTQVTSTERSFSIKEGTPRYVIVSE